MVGLRLDYPGEETFLFYLTFRELDRQELTNDRGEIIEEHKKANPVKTIEALSFDGQEFCKKTGCGVHSRINQSVNCVWHLCESF